MATTKVLMQVLDVGQGSGNLVEIYDGAKLINTMLIDLGSTPSTATSGDEAVAYVVATLQKMDNATIDVVALSHSDSDHINLIGKVLEQFDVDDLTINACYYGGSYDRYTKYGVDILAKIDRYMPKGISPLPFEPNSTTWDDKAKKWVPFHTTNEVKLCLVIGNCPTPGKLETPEEDTGGRIDGFTVNTWTTVVFVEWAGQRFVLTGDATGTTMAWANCVLHVAGGLSDVFMLTAPHHGSATSAFDIKGVTHMTTPEQNVELFSDLIRATTVTASAERKDRYKHPSAKLLKYFWRKRQSSDTYFWQDATFLTGLNRHFFTAYFIGDDWELSESGGGSGMDTEVKWPKQDGWYSVQTGGNMYSTLYFVAGLQAGAGLPESKVYDKIAVAAPAPPVGVRWTFSVLPNGTRGMSRSASRAALRQVTMRHIARAAHAAAPSHQHVASRVLATHAVPHAAVEGIAGATLGAPPAPRPQLSGLRALR
jgi:beta-lactamase superfamily II metal-dependent hydrolase